MGRIILITFLSTFTLSGCWWNRITIRNEVQEVKIPVMYCPAPSNIDRPELPIHNMTSDQRELPGELVKYYKATIKSLIWYSKELEVELYKYKQIHDKYKESGLDILNENNIDSPSTTTESMDD